MRVVNEMFKLFIQNNYDEKILIAHSVGYGVL